MVKDEKSYDTPVEMRRYIEHRIKDLEEKKADDSVVTHVEKLAEEAKRIAIAANEKARRPHECQQVSTLDEIRQELRAWRTTKTVGLVGLVVAIVAAAAFLVNLRASVVVLETNVADVRASVHQITENSNEMHKTISSQKAEKKGDDEQQIVAIQEKIDQAIKRIVEGKKIDAPSKSR
jgi:hypothetical protein